MACQIDENYNSLLVLFVSEVKRNRVVARKLAVLLLLPSRLQFGRMCVSVYMLLLFLKSRQDFSTF